MIIKGLMIFLLSLSSEATVCGTTDQRLNSYVSEIGRLNNGCTVTMIGRATAITAGHCFASLLYPQDEDNREVPDYVEFNVQLSSKDGEMKRSSLIDKYPIIVDSLFQIGADNFLNSKKLPYGNDFAILLLGPNEHTGMLPGDVQGFKTIDFSYFPQPGDVLQITGYGLTKSGKGAFSLTQRTHTGWLVKSSYSKGYFDHRIDTTGGNSGSAVIDVITGYIIGIHTHGGCSKISTNTRGNKATLIGSKKVLKQKIIEYLDWEQFNL